jgi:hypothetical protein
MPRVKEIEEGDPSTNADRSREVPPPKGDGNGMNPSTSKGSKADQLASELKVLKLEWKIAKLKKKLKTKNPKWQEMSSSSSNEEANDSSSDDDERSKVKRGKCKRSMGLILSLPIALLSIMILCLLTIPSHLCTPKSRPVLMGWTIPSGVTGLRCI